MNSCKHIHECFECGKPYICYEPSCISLPGPQGLCSKDSYIHGWAQATDRDRLEDWQW